MKFSATCLALILLLATQTLSIASDRTALYVDPVHGNDANGGTKPDSAFRTLGKAQAAARGVGPATVYLGGGIFRLQQPLVFNPEDSGQPNGPIIYQAYDHGPVVISGGKVIAGWTLHDSTKNIWQADVDPHWNFRQLYVNGRKAARTNALPPAGAVKNPTGYTIGDASLSRLRNPADIEIITHPHPWEVERLRIASIAPDHIVLTQPVLDLVSHGEYPSYGAILRLENAYEWIRDGGDWYLDRAAGKLYYKPRADEDMKTALVEAPHLDQLIVLKGSGDHPVSNLRFFNLTFTKSGWLGPSGPEGLVSAQANQMAPTVGEPGCAMPAAAVEATGARQVTFDHCTFTQLGGQGINFRHASQDDVVIRCDFHDLAASAIQVGAVGTDVAHLPENSAEIVSGITIEDCTVHHVVTEYPSGCGIFLGYVAHCSVLHNELFDLPYTGISLGWGWTGERAEYRSGNLIEFNRIHDYMKELVDGGGIYTNGYEKDGEIRGNYIYDQHHDFALIYLDDGSTNWTVTNNVTRSGNSGIAWYLYKGAGNRAAGNFTDTAKFMNQAPPPGDSTCLVEKTILLTGAKRPPDAQKIMKTSGPRPRRSSP